MQTTEQHAADTKLAEGYSQPAQQGGETAEACSVATPNAAAVGDESGEILHAAGVSELRPLAADTPDSAASADRLKGSLPAPFLIAAGAALSAELPTRGFSFGYDCAEGAVMPYLDEYGKPIDSRHGALSAPQVLSGDRGIRTEAVVMGVADVS